MNLVQVFIAIGIVAIDCKYIEALYLSNLTVPHLIDYRQRAKLSCTYDMNQQTLNSVKWYKDGQEFYRYSPQTSARTRLMFPVKGVTIAEGTDFCNQFFCNIELENLSPSSSGSYRCEVSGDAPDFRLTDKTANMTVGVLPKGGPYISGISHVYRYGGFLVGNCSSDWSNPSATLSWYIDNKKASPITLQPQREATRSVDGFLQFSSSLEVRFRIDNPYFLTKTELVQMTCIANLMDTPSLIRKSIVVTKIIALNDDGHNQRLVENDSGHIINPMLCLILTFSIILQYFASATRTILLPMESSR